MLNGRFGGGGFCTLNTGGEENSAGFCTLNTGGEEAGFTNTGLWKSKLPAYQKKK